jgi:Domain of unknown function (DUF3854)
VSLLAHHADLIDASAISDEVAGARGYRSVERKAELRRLGFGASQQNVPALLIPLFDVHGERAGYLLRPDEPRQIRGRMCKYEMPSGSAMVLDVPPPAREHLGDPARPLFITEGSRKADAAVSHGLTCVSITGVWAWRGTNEYGGKTALVAFESIALEKREVYLVFDSDVTVKPEVHDALRRLADFLSSRKASVRFIYLPPADDGSKIGLDDFLAAGNDVEGLLARASTELRSFDGERRACPHEETADGIVWHKSTDRGTEVQLTNFTARIISEVSRDDGVELEQRLEIEAELSGRRSHFSLEASKFAAMGWPIEHLGPAAILEPGQGTRDRARHAIQTLSGDIPRRIAVAHLGWREIAGQDCYFHASGAIDKNGVVDGVELAVSEHLQAFELPPPPRARDLRAAVAQTLRLLDLAPEKISFALLGAIGRAPLGHCDCAVWLYGETGTFKSELAALCQQHWGRRLDARHLPASFTATANFIEGLLFEAKDTLVVVDDFAPEGSAYDIQRAHREAARVIRSQGNLSARGRMRADSSLRPVKPPRGLLLATGEDIPRGHSVRARLLVVEVERGDVDVAKLTALQKAGAEGDLALATAAYVRHLAAAHEQVEAARREELEALRGHRADASEHMRTPAAVAELQIGLRCFLAFAVDVGALSGAEADQLQHTGAAALQQLGRRQRTYLLSSEPAQRFVELLGSAISSGAAHVADPSGGAPSEPGLWGWREVESGDHTNWRAQGSRVGWVEGDELWLEPDAAYAVAQDVARRVGDPFTVARTTLNKRLAERGFLSSTDLQTERSCVPVRRVIGGQRRQVLHLASATLTLAEQDAEQSLLGDGGRNGRSSDTGVSAEAPDDGTATNVTGAAAGAGPSAGEADHPDHCRQATAEEQAEVARITRKFFVSEEPDA